MRCWLHWVTKDERDILEVTGLESSLERLRAGWIVLDMLDMGRSLLDIDGLERRDVLGLVVLLSRIQEVLLMYGHLICITTFVSCFTYVTKDLLGEVERLL